jgi:hypothetical protein
MPLHLLHIAHPEAPTLLDCHFKVAERAAQVNEENRQHVGALYLAHKAFAPQESSVHHHLPREELVMASVQEISHALSSLGMSRVFALDTAHLACATPQAKALLVGTVKAALSLNQAAWAVSNELHEKQLEEAVVSEAEGHWAAAKAAALQQLQAELSLLVDLPVLDTTLTASVLKHWAEFEAFLDGKVHDREERRVAWERSERLKREHAAAVLPPSSMLSALLRASLMVAPRHPELQDIVSSGGAPPQVPHTHAQLLASLTAIQTMPSASASASASCGGGAVATGAEAGDALIHVDHCASPQVPQRLQQLLYQVIHILADAALPASPRLEAVWAHLETASQGGKYTPPVAAAALAAGGASASAAAPQLQ